MTEQRRLYGDAGHCDQRLALQNAFEHAGTKRGTPAIRMDAVCEPYIRRRALRHMEKGVLLFSQPVLHPALHRIPPPPCVPPRWIVMRF